MAMIPDKKIQKLKAKAEECKLVKREIEHLASFPQLNIDPILEVNNSGEITFFNNSATEMLKNLGLEADLKVYLPEDIDEIMNYLKGKERLHLYREVGIDGLTLEENIYLIPEFEVLRIYVRDITERKQAKEKLARQLQLNKAITDNAASCLFMVDKQGHTTFMNPAAETLTGYTMNEISYMPLHYAIHHHYPDGRVYPMSNCPVDNAKTKLIELKDYEDVFVRKDGTFFPVICHIAPLEDNGKVIGSILEFRNITEQKQTKEVLRANEEKFRSIFEQAAVGIIHVALNGKFLIANKRFCEITGYNKNEILELTFRDITHPEDTNKQDKVRQKVLDGKTSSYNLEKRYIRKGGNIIWANLTVSLVRKPDGEPDYFVSVIEDITERKFVEEVLLRQTRIASIGADIGKSLTSADTLQIMMSGCTDSLVRYLDLAFARIWTSNGDDKMQEFQSCSRMYATVDEPHYQVFVAKIVEERKPLLIANLIDDPGISDKEWVKRKGLVSFGGYPLLIDEKLIGVLAMFSRKQLSNEIFNAMIPVSDEIALGIHHKLGEAVVSESVDKLSRALDGVINTLSAVIEYRDPYTAGHQKRVSKLASAIAIEMKLLNEQVEGVRLAGLIHDLGKMNVPSEILSKPGKLIKPELDMLKTHCQVGYDILKEIEFPWPIAKIVYQHHEKMNGTGYLLYSPGESILMEARIICVADIVEAMSSHRPYRPALGIDLAVDEILKFSGVLYDSDVVDACVRVIKEKGFEFE